MSLQFKTVSLTFGGQDTMTSQVNFPAAVNSASVALQGFSLSYSDGNQEVSTIQVGVSSITVSGTHVSFTVTLVMRDDSGHSAVGNVSALVIADVSEG